MDTAAILAQAAHHAYCCLCHRDGVTRRPWRSLPAKERQRRETALRLAMRVVAEVQGGIAEGESNLHIFIRETDGGYTGDVVIAASYEDACEIFKERHGVEDAGFRSAWAQWPDEEPYRVVDADQPGQPERALLPAEWIAFLGGVPRYWYGWA